MFLTPVTNWQEFRCTRIETVFMCMLNSLSIGILLVVKGDEGGQMKASDWSKNYANHLVTSLIDSCQSKLVQSEWRIVVYGM